MNSSQRILDAVNEFRGLTNRIVELNGNPMDKETMITILLKGLPLLYESCCQNLQLYKLSLHQVIEALRTTEASIATTTTAPTDSIIGESANRAIKKNSDNNQKKRIKCFNYRERGYMSKDCLYNSKNEKSKNQKYSQSNPKCYIRITIKDSTSNSDKSANQRCIPTKMDYTRSGVFPEG